MAAADTQLRRRRSWAYENARPEVQSLVPLDAGRIVDAGCASGRLGEALKRRQGAEIIGVELDPEYAQHASHRLDEVIVADLEDVLPASMEQGTFDCVIAADVLEHLRDPWSALSRLTGLLRPGGTVVVSLPNVRYWEVFWVIGRYGVFPRRDEGIFDREHLRWFTRADALELLEQAGLEVARVEPQFRLRPARPRTARQAQWFARTPLAPFVVFQYVLAGVKPGEARTLTDGGRDAR